MPLDPPRSPRISHGHPWEGSRAFASPSDTVPRSFALSLGCVCQPLHRRTEPSPACAEARGEIEMAQLRRSQAFQPCPSGATSPPRRGSAIHSSSAQDPKAAVGRLVCDHMPHGWWSRQFPIRNTAPRHARCDDSTKAPPGHSPRLGRSHAAGRGGRVWVGLQEYYANEGRETNCRWYVLLL